MRRSALSGLMPVLAAAAATALVSACGTAGSSSTATRTRPAAPTAALTVSPPTGAPTTAFEVRFTAPAQAGVSSGSRRSFELGVRGPQKAGCVGATSVSVPTAAAGAPVALVLDPAKLGGRWCAGTYQARVDEVQRPVCSPGMMCPQFVRVIGTVGRTSFRVVSAA
jgi:hypothetical protein